MNQSSAIAVIMGGFASCVADEEDVRDARMQRAQLPEEERAQPQAVMVRIQKQSSARSSSRRTEKSQQPASQRAPMLIQSLSCAVRVLCNCLSVAMCASAPCRLLLLRLRPLRPSTRTPTRASASMQRQTARTRTYSNFSVPSASCIIKVRWKMSAVAACSAVYRSAQQLTSLSLPAAASCSCCVQRSTSHRAAAITCACHVD